MRGVTGLRVGLALIGLVGTGLVLLLARQTDDGSDSEATSGTAARPDEAPFVATERQLSSELALLPAEAEIQHIGPAVADGVLTARVVDERGQPREGVEVLLKEEGSMWIGGETPDDPLTSMASARAVTRLDGSLSLGQPATGRLTVLLKAPGGWREPATTVVLLPGMTVDVGSLVVHDLRELTGHVQDPAGEPIPDAEVLCTDQMSFETAYVLCGVELVADRAREGVLPDEAWLQSFVHAMHQSATARTDAQGEFHVRVGWSPDGYFVAARAGGFTLETCRLKTASSQEPIALSLRPARARLAGRVVDAQGGPPPPGTVVIAQTKSAAGGPYGRAARVQPDGSFALEGLIDAPQDVVARHPDRRPSKSMVARPGQASLTLELGAAPTLVIHAERDGVPLDEFDVLTFSYKGWPWEYLPDWETHTAGPGAAGELRLSGLQAALTTIEVVAGTACSEPQRIDLRKNGAPDLHFELAEASVVSGTVVDAQSGAAIEGASVEVGSLLPCDYANSSCMTDAAGLFKLGPLPASTWTKSTLDASAGAYRLAEIEPGPGRIDGLRIALDPCVLVHIRVGPLLKAALRDPSASAAVDNVIEIYAGGDGPRDDEAKIRITPLDSDDEARTFSVGSTGLVLASLRPGRYRLGLARESDGGTGPEFTAIGGQLVTVDY